MKRSSLDDYIGIRTYYVARAVFRSVIDRYTTLDTLSTWTLDVTGLAVGFLFTNLEKVNNFLRASKFDDQFTSQLRDTINLLALRAGHEAKVAVDINLFDLQLPASSIQKIDEQLIKIREEVQKEYLESVPPPYSALMKRAIEAYNRDPLSVLKRAHSDYMWQFVTLTVQLLTLFLALLIASVNLK